MNVNKPIYVASACVRGATIADSVQQLVDLGIENIELTGGTDYYDGFEKELLSLQEKHDLSFRCHNYFPPPKVPFVLNLASLDEEVFSASLSHIRAALKLSQRLGANRYAFHAGYFIKIRVDELGKRIKNREIEDMSAAKAQFFSGVRQIREEFPDFELYVENNVFSQPNADSYGGVNPLMCTNWAEMQEMLKEVDVKVLFDIGHLYVSCNTLGLNFEEESRQFFAASDYLHISDNAGKEDENLGLSSGSNISNFLAEADLSDKDLTIEVYSGIEDIRNTIASLNQA